MDAIKQFLSINIDSTNIPNFVDKKRWLEAKAKFKELKQFINDMLINIENNDSIPKFLIDKALSYANTFKTHFNRIVDGENITGEKDLSAIARNFKNFERWYSECIEYHPGDNGKSNKFYEVYNTIRILGKPDFGKELLDVKEIKKEILSNKDTFDTLLEEIQKKHQKLQFQITLLILASYQKTIIGNHTYGLLLES